MNKLLILGGILVPLAILIAFFSTSYWEDEIFVDSDSDDGLKRSISLFFKKADEDGSGSLDEHEFQTAIKKLLQHGLIAENESNRKTAKELEKEAEDFAEAAKEVAEKLEFKEMEGEIVPLQVNFKPFSIQSMSKFQDKDRDAAADFHINDLKEWKHANIQGGYIAAANFSVFLPPYEAAYSVGHPWYIIKSEKDDGVLEHNHYYPRRPTSREERLLFTLLSMFHPRPFLQLRFNPKGTVACVRAHNSELVDIFFRVHAEFQMNVPPRYPFWFTPAQFAGRVIMNKNATSVKYFKMYLPNVQKLNVDMEWITGIKEKGPPGDRYNMEVDIGYHPEMSVESNGSISVGNTAVPLFELENVVWESEISEKKAISILEIEFFPFKKVPYLPFNESFKAADEQDKLVHSILLWGTLDDQAC